MKLGISDKLIGYFSLFDNSYLNELKSSIYRIIPYKMRNYDKEFYRFLNLLRENENKSYNKIKEYQFLKMRQILNNAFNFTKLYKEKFNSSGFNPKNFDSIDDLEEIPILRKEEIRNRLSDMILRNFKGKVYYGYTSGTTGTPLVLLYDKNSISRELASIYYIWERIGYGIEDGRVEFRGYIGSNKDFVHLPNQRILRINIIKMSEKNIDSIINKIKSVGYEFFMGYPSAIFKFTNILEKKNKEIIPKGIMLASEVVYDWQVEKIESFFRINKIMAHYGQAERVALGFWNNNRNYQFIPTYGLLELNLNTNHLIATGFINESIPMIRYRLTDTVSSFQETPFKNNSLFPIINTIFGREEDITYNSKGEEIPPAIVTFPFKKIKLIRACKIVQNNLDNFDLIIEAEKNGDTIKEVNELIIGLKKIYGNDVKIYAQFVNKIPLNKSGKFRWIDYQIKKTS